MEYESLLALTVKTIVVNFKNLHGNVNCMHTLTS